MINSTIRIQSLYKTNYSLPILRSMNHNETYIMRMQRYERYYYIYYRCLSKLFLELKTKFYEKWEVV